MANAQAQQARREAEIALCDNAQQLQQALHEVKSANDRLEKEVAERTAELRRQTDYLLALIDNVPFRVWLKDTEGRFLAVNRAQAATYGSTPQQIVGRTDFDLIDEETARERLAADREVMRSRRPVKRELTLTGPDRMGSIESYKAAVFDAAGNVLGTIGYARDIVRLETAGHPGERAHDPRRS